MKKSIAGLSITAIALVGVSSGAASANSRPVQEGGDNQHCVVYSETGKVWFEMPRRRVARVLDTKGHRVRSREMVQVAAIFGVSKKDLGDISQVRSYPLCDGEGTMFLVAFDNFDRVSASFYE